MIVKRSGDGAEAAFLLLPWTQRVSEATDAGRVEGRLGLIWSAPLSALDTTSLKPSRSGLGGCTTKGSEIFNSSSDLDLTIGWPSSSTGSSSGAEGDVGDVLC